MARRTFTMNERLELAYQWHRGRGIREISRSLGMDRKTVAKQVKEWQEKGLSREKPLPSSEELAALLNGCKDSGAGFERPAQQLMEQYRSQVEKWREDPHMTIRQMHRLLEENHGLRTSYMSVYRFVRSQFEAAHNPVTVRLETAAGEQAQVDFGYVGRLRDPETGQFRRAWVFAMVLSYSRHRFVRFVFSQDLNTWLDCHIRSFNFFQGVPKSLVLDNLKDGVLKPDLYDPTLNRAYAELERHYGFVADPAKVRMANHKGKIERVIPVIRQQLMAGCEYRDIEEANCKAEFWCREKVGRREHGTTHRLPFVVFEEEERSLLLPLPMEPFEAPVWKACRAHPDCHVVFEKSYYSVPYRYRGEELWIRAGLKVVRIYRDHELIKTHVRASRPGSWQTDERDYPPEKLAYLEKTPTYCRHQAAELGSHVAQYVEHVLSSHAMRHLRKAQGVVRLGQKYGAQALDGACRRAVGFGNYRYHSLKEILDKGLWKEEPAELRPASPSLTACRFGRPASYFRHSGKETP
jgi:transposase